MKSKLIILAAFLILFLLTGYSFFTLGTQSKAHELTKTIEDLKEQGYTQFWAEHKALVELNIIPADSIYIMIQED